MFNTKRPRFDDVCLVQLGEPVVLIVDLLSDFLQVLHVSPEEEEEEEVIIIIY